MELSMIIPTIFVLLIHIYFAFCHPQCLDFRPPFSLIESLTFCTEYAYYGCCTNDQDAQIAQEFETFINTWIVPPPLDCQEYYKNFFCQVCSPYAAHIYDAETTTVPTEQPGICQNYCNAFYDNCSPYDPYSPTPLGTNRDTTCRRYDISDIRYCYPELISNPILNADIERETITRDGCLCLERFASDLRNPLSFDVTPDGTGRIFIGEQIGIVSVYWKNGTRVTSEPFLDISNIVLTSSNPGDERGFLGFTFHPNFRNNQRLFAYFSFLSSGQQTIRISEFRVQLSNPNRVDRNSERMILEVPQPYSNHNGGELLFGIDGYLYAFVGDGGAGGDPHNYAQDKSTLLGKVLRLDIDSQPTPGMNYSIPPDNPFVSDPNARSEIYAYGIRNTWRCDVDEGDPTTGANRGRIICGDVGQSRYEELNIIIKGGNYGWNSREGFECYRSDTCGRIGPEELPIYAYSHSVGGSITGGHMYRGCMSPNLNGQYIYGDYVVGKIFSLEETTSGWQNKEITMCGSDVCFNGLSSNSGRNILSFGEDGDGEVYVLSTDYPSPTAYRGAVYKLVDPRRRGDQATCRSSLERETGTTNRPTTTTTRPTTTTTTTARPTTTTSRPTTTTTTTARPTTTTSRPTTTTTTARPTTTTPQPTTTTSRPTTTTARPTTTTPQPTTTTSRPTTTTARPTTTTYRSTTSTATRQTATTVQPTGCVPVDLAFLFDSSGSVTITNWYKMLNITEMLLNTFEISVQCTKVALLSFGTDGYLYSDLNQHQNRQEIYYVLMSMPFKDEWTNTGAAIYRLTHEVFTTNQGDRSDVTNVAIIFTDGPSNRERDRTVPNAQTARTQGVEFISIGLGQDVDMPELQAITGNASRIIYLNSFDSMLNPGFVQNIRQRILDISGINNNGSGGGSGNDEDDATSGVDEEPPVSGNKIWSCSFEDTNDQGTWCDLEQGISDQFDWTLTNEPTPSDPTGPSLARSGSYYVFIEATLKTPLDQAWLYLQPLPLAGQYCLQFSYHMFGWHVDTLSVAKEIPGQSVQILWSEFGEQGDFWIDLNITLSINEKERLLFIGQRGYEYSGDIGLDSLALARGTCQ